MNKIPGPMNKIPAWYSDLLLYPTDQIKKNTIAVRETSASRHMGGPIKAPFKPFYTTVL